MQLWDDAGGNHQRFAITATDSGYFRITPVHSGKNLAIGAASTAEDTLPLGGASTADGAAGARVRRP